MSDIFTPLRKGIGAGFKGRTSKGNLYRARAEVVDMRGDVVSSSDEVYAFEGFVELYSEYFRVTAGIPDTDVRIIIFGTSISVEPAKDDRIKMTTGPFKDHMYQLRTSDSDPAKATFTCRAYEIEDLVKG